MSAIHLRDDLQALIVRAARQQHGAARTGAPAPLPLLRAANDVEIRARIAKKAAIEAARGAGESWDAIADALGLDGVAGWPAAQRAFDEVAGRRYTSLPNQPPPMAYWTCTTCGRPVEETGPPGSDPSVAEQGHTDDCARHQAAVADYAIDLAR